MRHLFIINPVAGKGKTLALIPEINRFFKEREDEHIIEITKRPGHAVEIAREYSKKEAMRIYSIGGDGTLNEVLNGMAKSDSVLGIIPCGSGNDFIKSLTEITDMNLILKNTIYGSTVPVDLCSVNGRYFINIASIGFDAEVVLNSHYFKKLPGISGSMAYILGIFTSVIKRNIRRIEINIDNIKVINTDVLLVAIANGRYYGGGMLAAPDARLNDGEFDVCVIGKMSRLKILMFFPKFIKGEHGTFKEVEFFKARSISINSYTEFPQNIDGEVSIAKKVVCDIIPGGVKVIVPIKL